jgi:hypothetical protein
MDNIINEINLLLKEKVKKEHDPRDVDYFYKKEQIEFAKFLVELFDENQRA